MSLWMQSAARAGRGASSHPMLHWLVSLGGLGLLGVAIIDSSVIPLPLPGSTDLLLLLLTAHRGTTAPSAILLASCAIAGSIVGGYLTWSAGRKGGEVTFDRYVPKRFRSRITGWVKKHGAWSAGLAAMLPPPIPLTPFLLAAGALGVARRPFLICYGLARTIRYSLLAWLGLTFGRHIVNLWRHQLNNWSAPILWTYCSLLALGIGYGVWKFLRSRSSPKPASLSDVA